MDSTLELLRQQFGELGLNLSVWDHLGRMIGKFTPCCEFCRMVLDSGGPCIDTVRETAARTVAEGKPIHGSTPHNGCVLGVPIRRRRRLVGAGVVCFPTREMLDEESLGRMCDQMKLDRTHMERLGRESFRHSTDEANDFLKLLQWMLERDQAAEVARNELHTLSGNLATTYEELSLLYRVSGAMRVTQHPREFFQKVLEELLDVMNISSSAAVIFAHPPVTDENIIVTAGRIPIGESEIQVLTEEHLIPHLTRDQRAVLDNRFVSVSDAGVGDGVKNIIAVPLTIEETLVGVLIGINKRGADFDSIDLKLMNSIGNQGSIFFSNHSLYADLQDLLMGVLHALTAMIDTKDPYTCGHSERVALISRRLATMHGFDPAKVERIYLCGLLHDIGKIGINDSILTKEGRLTPEEFEDIKRHPDVGARVLSGIRQLEDIIVGIRTHHERLDGGGYPQGLEGEDIPIEGLIVGLADSFDAMTSDRTYRKALPLEKVRTEIRDNAGTQFDEELARKFLALDLEGFLNELRGSHDEVLEFSAAGRRNR